MKSKQLRTQHADVIDVAFKRSGLQTQLGDAPHQQSSERMTTGSCLEAMCFGECKNRAPTWNYSSAL